MKYLKNGRKYSRLLFLAAAVLALLGTRPDLLAASADKGYSLRGKEPQTLLLDRFEITVTEETIAAFSPDSQTHSIPLLPGELVREVFTEAQVGAVVTSERLLAIGPGGIPWMTLSLEAGERAVGGYLSSHLILFVTDQRVAVFDSEIPRFVISDLPVGERVDDQAVLPAAAVFVTRDRAVGYTLGSAVFRDMLFAPGERVRRLEIAETLISVETSKRTLIFQSSDGRWVQHGLTLDERSI